MLKYYKNICATRRPRLYWEPVALPRMGQRVRSGQEDHHVNSLNTQYFADSNPAAEHPAIEDPNTLYVLIVDDSAVMREMLNLKLRELAADSLQLIIDMAGSGDEALRMARTNPYDLVFMDVEMPGMSGLDACREIKTIRPARVAMVSGRAASNDHSAGHDAGCDNYLTKPPHDADLRVILRLVSIKKLTQI